MGYATTQKGYLLYDLTSHTFFVHRDVIFKEEIFPFQLQHQHPTTIFNFTGSNDEEITHTQSTGGPHSTQETSLPTEIPDALSQCSTSTYSDLFAGCTCISNTTRRD